MNSASTTLELASAAEAIYAVLGRRAGEVSDDGYVVGLYEMSRACGEASLALREAADVSTVTPNTAVASVLDQSFDDDGSGALAIYATTMVVLPRLLVALRDARVGPTDSALTETLVRVSTTVVSALRRLAQYAHDEDIYDDQEWQSAARALSKRLDDAGYAESLVISR